MQPDGSGRPHGKPTDLLLPIGIHRKVFFFLLSHIRGVLTSSHLFRFHLGWKEEKFCASVF